MPPGSETISYLDQLTVNARKRLIETSGDDGGYTRTIDVSRLIWRRMKDHSDQVISVDAAMKTKRAVEEHLLDRSKPDATAPQPFVFSIIGFITYEDFFAMSCGNWRGPRLGAPTFADAKLTFTAKAPPDHPILSKDFHESCEKLRQIFQEAKTSDAHARQGVFIEPPHSPLCETKLRFTHRLFEIIEDDDSDDGVDAGVPPEFTIHRWPVASEQAKRALAEMTASHRVNHLAAFDATPEGNLIRPDAYTAELRGALAQIRFTLSHWNICPKSEPPRDVFMANIVHIRILNPPTNSSASPSKRQRKFTAQDEVSGDISPKKPRLGP